MHSHPRFSSIPALFVLLSFSLAAPVSAQSIRLPHKFSSGAVGVGEVGVRNLNIQNNGAQPLNVTVTPRGPFSVVGSHSVTIPPKGKASVPIAFGPSAAGLTKSAIDITSNDPANPSPSLPASGVGVPGNPSVPRGIVLPPIRKTSTTATTRAKTLRNTGKGVLIGTIDPPLAPFSLISGGGPFILNPKKSQAFVLEFAPTAVGKFTGKLPFNTNNPKKQSFSSTLLGRANNAVKPPVGPPPPPLPPVTGCQLPAVTLPGGGKLPVDAASAEALLNTLTALNPGALPQLSQLTGSLPGGVPDLSSLPVLGTISANPLGKLSGLPLSLPSSPPSLGSLVPADPGSIPVLGALPIGSSSVCQAVNGVIAVTGGCGQAIGVIVTEASAALSSSDITTLEGELGSVASAQGLQDLAGNPTQIAGLLTNAAPQLAAIEGLASQVEGGLKQCSNSLPSIASGPSEVAGLLPALALPGNTVPTLGQLTGSLPNGASLFDVPVLGAIVTGTVPSLMPSPPTIPTLGTLTAGITNAATLLKLVPVIGSLPTGGAADQVLGVIAIVDGTSKTLVAMLPVVGPTNGAPDPAQLIALLTDGTTFPNLAPDVSTVESLLATPVGGLASGILAGQIAQTSGLDALASGMLTTLKGLIPSLP